MRVSLAVASLLLVAACGASADSAADAEGSLTFALRPVGFQNEKAPEYTAAAERCLTLPGVSGGPVNSASPAFYSLAADGGNVAELRRCVTDIGADAQEVPGRPGEERGRAEFIANCVEGEGASAEDRFVGMSEAEVEEAVAGPVRVICRDRVFLDRTTDRHPTRLNIVVEQGLVIWAGSF